MRKHIIAHIPDNPVSGDPNWLDLAQLAQVEISSEDPGYPIEAALLPGAAGEWRAAQAGAQTIRVCFDQPQHLTRIRVVFVDTERTRTQECVLRWSADGGNTYRDIVRQQWNFSPPHSTREVEEYRVNLALVTVFDLHIVPDMSGGTTHASLAEMRLA